MSVRAKGAVALLLLGFWGACWYLDAFDRCFSSGGGWHRFSGCYSAEGSGAGSGEKRPVVRLVDSMHWRVEMGMDDEGDLWHAAVVQGRLVDTIPSIRVREIPIVVGDSVVTGLSYLQGELRSGFRYLIRGGRLDSIPLIEAIQRAWIHPAISPDGQLIAYWSLTGDGVGRIEIADWPGQGEIRAGPVQVVGAGDASPGLARWIAADTLEYAIWGEGGRVLKGRWTPSGFTPVDTTQAD